MFYKGLKIIKFEGGKMVKNDNIIHFEQGYPTCRTILIAP